jgi:hypothetical protein
MATVHWVCTREGANSDETTIEKAYNWNERRKGFVPKQITLACEVLKNEAWM